MSINSEILAGESERLIRARRAHGRFSTASDAARALGIPPPTYLAHENGSRGFSKEDAARYARFYRVSVEWLYLGYGPQKPGDQHRLKGSRFQPTFIRQWRKYRDLTQEDLAERADMSPANLSNIETGKQGYTQENLEALAHGLNCEVVDLLARDPTEPCPRCGRSGSQP